MNTHFNSNIFTAFLTSLALFLLLLSTPLLAQDCDCDHVISTTRGYIRASDMPTVKPGDVICIQAGVRSRLKFVGFQGTKEQPLIFKNCGGQVIFDRTVDNTTLEGALIFDKSRYFRVTGTGSPNHKYGFYVRKTNGSALHATDSDFEIDHVEIGDAGFAGIFAKVEALCNNFEYHRGKFVMQNISIHDNYIHNTHGEGMYIGSSWYAGKKMDCGKLYPPEIHGLRVFNNIVENTGADGIQIGCATKDVEVYNNTIRGYGLDPFKPVQNNGLMLNPGCSGKYYNNKIFNGSGMGIICFGIGNVYMFNNLVVNAGYDGIFIDERSAMIPGTGFHAHNNTIVTPGRDGMRINSRNSVGNTFINNIVVKPGSLSQEYYNKSQYLCAVDNTVDYSQKNNLFLPTVEEAKFMNVAGGDFQLKAESPAVNKGFALSYFNFDINRAARPNGTAFDIGAYEYTGTNRISNLAPVVSAGTDKSLTLPTNSTTLIGTATDSDGSIASVSWSKISGPSASLSGQSSRSLSLSNLVAGTYVFRFSATDNSGLSSSDETTVVVKSSTTNAAPLASAGSDNTITLPTNSLSISGAASDSDGTIASTVWTKVNGPAATMSGSSTLVLKLSNLVAGTYTFSLTVKDNQGASKTDDVVVTVNAVPITAVNGLNYKYYTTSSSNPWKVLPNFSQLRPVKTGIVSNFTLNPKAQSDYFGFVFEGLIQIDVAGTYTFYSYSDDGSKLFINGALVVNNDGTHSPQERSGSVYLGVGKHAIKVIYFEYINSETLSVRYQGPGISKRLIPNTKLFPASTATLAETEPEAQETEEIDSTISMGTPGDLMISLNPQGNVVLTWTDNSSDELEFEVHMSTGNTSRYKLVGSAGENKTQYTVTGISSEKDYYFKVRARRRLSYSAYSNEAPLIQSVSQHSLSVENSEDTLAQAMGSTEVFQKILVNFNYGSNAPAPWNNFDVDPDPDYTLGPLVDGAGNTTAVRITLLTPWGWANTGSNGWNAMGMKTGDNSGVFPDDVISTSFWTERTEGEELLIEGLEPNQYYSFTFFASREVTDARITHYSIGKTTVSLDASLNTSKTATISGAKADANGKVKIYVHKDENSPYGYLNAMTIERSTSPFGDEMATTVVKEAYTTKADSTSLRKASQGAAATIRENFSAYPNPATDHIIVRYDQLPVQSQLFIQLIDLSGTVRLQRNASTTDRNGSIRIDLGAEQIASGYYLLQISAGSVQKTIKVLKM